MTFTTIADRNHVAVYHDDTRDTSITVMPNHVVVQYDGDVWLFHHEHRRDLLASFTMYRANADLEQMAELCVSHAMSEKLTQDTDQLIAYLKKDLAAHSNKLPERTVRLWQTELNHTIRLLATGENVLSQPRHFYNIIPQLNVKKNADYTDRTTSAMNVTPAPQATPSFGHVLASVRALAHHLTTPA